MLRRRVFLTIGFVLLLVFAGCGSDAVDRLEGGPSGPRLVPVASILIPESDTLYIGFARPPVLDPYDGSIYISDTISKRVLRFDRTGNVIQVYGRPGSGPGEFQFNGLVFILDDATVVVVDELTQRLKFFDRESGKYREQRVFYQGAETVAGYTPPVRIAEDLWFASMDPMRFLALARWNLPEDSVERLGPMPEEYRISRAGDRPSYANAMMGGGLAFAEGALVRGWHPRNDLIRYDLDGSIVDTLDIPAARRRGVPANLRELYDLDPVGLKSDRLTLFSYLSQLHTRPDGSLAFTHFDREILSEDGPLPVMVATVWAGVTSPDLSHACVDAPVPTSSDAMPAAAFRGDTLFVFDRRIVDDIRLETRIDLYLIDTAECDWIPLRR